MDATVIRGPLLCLGDPLVDLICEQPIAEVSAAPAFVPHTGGVVANVAIAAARAGARVGLAGGAGEDGWGGWLRARLEHEGVALEHFRLLRGRTTPLALVAIDGAGEPAYTVYGEPDSVLVEAVGNRVDDAVAGAAGLFVSSNTLVEGPARELTMRAREQALGLGLPVIFDPNLRLNRWRSAADAAASANACVPGALLVRCNAAEAAVMTGEDDPERAAAALVKAGARLVVVTLGPHGAILRGELRAAAPAVPVAQLRSAVGAGDVLTGLLLARLALSGFYPAAVAAALPEAMARAAAACERWGALD